MKQSKLSLGLGIGLSLGLLLPSGICQASAYGGDYGSGASAGFSASLAVADNYASYANASYASASYANAGYANAGYTNAGYSNAGYSNASYTTAGYANVFDSSSIPTFSPMSSRASHAFNQDLGDSSTALYGYTKVAGTSTSTSKVVSSAKGSASQSKSNAKTNAKAKSKAAGSSSSSSSKTANTGAAAGVGAAAATTAAVAGATAGIAANAGVVNATAADEAGDVSAGTVSKGVVDEGVVANTAASANGNSSMGNKVPLLDEGADQAFASCLSSFNETRQRILQANTQSVILHSNSNGIAPFIMLQIAAENGSHYVLWQSLNGDIRGYALRDGKGFDYANNANTPLPLSWHPTLIWDNLFGAELKLKNYSCVLTGRTRVMGKRVSLLRFIPQEGLRYSLLLAKEDESDFPVELSLMDPKGGLVSRLTTMDSRIIVGVDFPLADTVFDRIERSQQEGRLGHDSLIFNRDTDAMVAASAASAAASSAASAAALSAGGKNDRRDPAAQLHLPSPTVNAGAAVPASVATAATASSRAMGANASGNEAMGMDMSRADGVSNAWAQLQATSRESLKPWPELNIPEVYTIIASGPFAQGGNQCFYQEFSDGITSFRVYRNQRSTNFYPALSNGSISCVRKNTLHHEYAVVGEVPVALAEFVLAKIVD